MRAMQIAAAAMLVLVATTAQAQGGQAGGPPGGGMGQGGGAGRMNEMLFKGITLTEVQKQKVDSIQAASRSQMQALRQAGGGQADAGVMEKINEVRTKQNKDIRALLTAEQQTVFDKNLAEMPQPGAGRRPPTEI